MLAQQRCGEKSNEIMATVALLPTLALTGSIVAIDAMACRTVITETIITQGGDYLLSVMDYQPKLGEDIQEIFAVARFEDYRHLESDISETLDRRARAAGGSSLQGRGGAGLSGVTAALERCARLGAD
jgi:predicted transposase YbfD/YdcC